MGTSLKVCDLIDDQLRRWRTDLVREMFWEEDANEALLMPLPVSEVGDILICHFT